MLHMWHKNYPLHLMYVCTLRCKVMRVKNMTKHNVISQAKTRGLRQKQFPLCYKHIICLQCYYERLKCSPLVLHAVRW